LINYRTVSLHAVTFYVILAVFLADDNVTEIRVEQRVAVIMTPIPSASGALGMEARAPWLSRGHDRKRLAPLRPPIGYQYEHRLVYRSGRLPFHRLVMRNSVIPLNLRCRASSP